MTAFPLPQALRMPLLLGLLPFALLLLTIVTAGRDLLVWDEWVVWSELLARIDDAGLRFPDLLAQHNEQRMLPPRLVGLAFMPFFQLNRFAEYFFNAALAACTCLALCSLYVRTLAPRRDIWRFGVSALALFCFSLTQWETFLVGLNINISCTTLGMVLGAWLVSREPLGRLRMAALLVAGFLASFDMINGLLYWPALLPAIALAGKPGRKWRMALWLAAGTACWVGYFYGFIPSGHHPNIFQTLAQPLRLLAFFFTTLGAACVSDPDLWILPLLLGLSACLLLLRNLLTLWRHDKDALRVLLPWLCLLVFALLSAAAISVGRSLIRDMGYAQQSRYVTLCIPFWAALLALDASAAAVSAGASWLRRARAVFWGLILTCIVVTNIGLFFHLQEKGHFQDAMHRELFRLQDEALLLRLFPDPVYLAAHLPLFLKYRLSPYNRIGELASYSRLPVPPKDLRAEFHATPEDRGFGGLPGFRLQGTAFLVQARQPAKMLFLLRGEQIVYAGAVEADGAFALFMPVTQLASGLHTLEAWALLPDGKLVPVGGKFQLDVPDYVPKWTTVHKRFSFPERKQSAFSGQ